jgi:acetyl esterase/lipase
MRMIFLLAALTIAILAAAYHFAALQVFNFIVPKDAGTVVLARDLAFGPDPEQSLDIYAPEGSQQNLPVLLFVHGGSWESGGKDNYEFAGRSFAAQGFLTLVADYRKRPEHPYPSFVEDAALALAFAQKQAAQFGGDDGPVVAVGHSAGAYNLAQAVLDRRYLMAAGVDESGIKAVVTLAGPFDFLPLDTRVSIETFGQVADLASTQPITFARGDAPPFLLLTGTEDTTVRPRNSEALFSKLAGLGAKVQIKHYAGVGHVGILLRTAKPFRRAATPVLDDIMAFVNR